MMRCLASLCHNTGRGGNDGRRCPKYARIVFPFGLSLSKAALMRYHYLDNRWQAVAQNARSSIQLALLDSKNGTEQKGVTMNKSKIRLMKVEDFGAVVQVDEKVFKASRSEYYKLKFETVVQSTDHLPTSLVAEDKNGKVVGFVIGELYIGEYGITEGKATLDTIGVDPDYQHKGIGEELINEFMDHLRALGVKKVSTLVNEDDAKLTHFFRSNEFSPSKTINLERSL